MGVDAYRLLNIYDRESNFYKTGGGTYETKIHKKHLKSFIEYVTNEGITNNATRISEYHKIQEREIFKNMFLPIKFNIAGINMSSQIVDSKYLRYELHKKLTDGFNEIIKKEYKDGTLIKTNKDIGSIIHHKTLSNIFNSILIEQYDIYTFKNKENTNPFPFSETLKTFLSKISLLNRSFTRGVHGNFIEVKIDQNIFSDNTIKKIFLNKLFNDVITRVLEKQISTLKSEATKLEGDLENVASALASMGIQGNNVDGFQKAKQKVNIVMKTIQDGESSLTKYKNPIV